MAADAGHYGGSRYFGRKDPRKQVLDFLRRTLTPNARRRGRNWAIAIVRIARTLKSVMTALS